MKDDDELRTRFKNLSSSFLRYSINSGAKRSGVNAE